MENSVSSVITLHGKTITEDAFGNLLLDDLWELSKAKASKQPKHWRTSAVAKQLIQELQKKVTNSNLKQKSLATPVVYAKQGRGNLGTFAHPILAAAYAGYLSPKIEIEVREIWLRYRAGDATLADEILQRATAEANLWAGTRALSRSQRVAFTDVLKAHGVQGKGYMHCTEAVYLSLLGGHSFELRTQRGLAVKTNLREKFDVPELSFVMAAEALSAERIEEENSQGNFECQRATARSAKAIRKAIDEDRRDRQRSMI
jgi:hypothetical protein